MYESRVNPDEWRKSHPNILETMYGKPDRLRTRQEIYARYTVPSIDYFGWIVDHLELSGGERVLDVGCGNGAYHATLAGRGASVIAVDQSSTMLEECEAKAAERGVDVTPVHSIAQDLPLPDDSADAAMVNHVLHHLPEAERAVVLREMLRVVRPGGRIVIAVNAADHLGRLRELHGEIAENLGFVAATQGFLKFTLDSLPFVASVLPGASASSEDAWLEIDSAEMLTDFYLSFMVDFIVDRPADDNHREILGNAFRDRAEAHIAEFGTFRDVRPLACFVGGSRG